MSNFNLEIFRKYFTLSKEHPLEVYRDCYLITEYVGAEDNTIFTNILIPRYDHYYKLVCRSEDLNNEHKDKAIERLKAEYLKQMSVSSYLEILETSANLIKELIINE